MKLEIIKETKFGEETAWYELHADGHYIKGSYNLPEIKELYEKAKIVGGDLKSVKKEVLISEEI
jgi:hypothetical protein